MLPEVFLTRPIAHRALHDRGAGRPENGLGAVKAAVCAGYGIEIDLQRSADDQAMVFHDDDLARLTGVSGPIRQRTAEELRTLTLTGSGERIPTLRDVLCAVAGRVPLVIEVKDQDGAMGPDIGTLEKVTAEALKSYDGPAALMSFNPFTAERLAELCPERPIGLTTCAATPEAYPALPAHVRARLAQIAFPAADRLDFISHHHADLDNPRLAELKAQGLSILCWTIRTPQEEALARAVADNITFEGYMA